jgi:glycosyltransferase involved in cell wall biosynthesis
LIAAQTGEEQLRTISIVTACYNEEENVGTVYNRVREVMAGMDGYLYEHIFIDNNSTDKTVELLKFIAAQDTNVKVLVNSRNFGQIRSPMYALSQTVGDAVIGIVADLQDPPEMIPEFLRGWADGFSVVLAIKESSEENALMFLIRKAYYRIVNQIASIETFENFTGFGLYDRRVIDLILALKDPYPYFRGLIAEIGLPYKTIKYAQPARKLGITKNNFYSLYDIGMLGVTNLSKLPLRLTTFFGFFCSLVSVLVALVYLVYKLCFWNNFSVGIAPLIIGIFFLGSVQLVSIGVLGEYIAAIHTYVQARPYAVEKERVNFGCAPGAPRTVPVKLSDEPS